MSLHVGLSIGLEIAWENYNNMFMVADCTPVTKIVRKWHSKYAITL
jgi:hypothetical protein